MSGRAGVTDELHGQELSAYAFDLLDAAARARVEAHLRACTACAEELAELRAVIATLPRARPAEPAPEAAWQAIETRIRARAAAQRADWWPGRWVRAGRLQPALTAALALAVVGLVVWNATLQARDTERRVELPGLSNAERVTVVDLVPAAASSDLDGQLIMSQDQQQGGLVIGELPALPSGRTYQVWFVRGDQTRASGGTFGVDSLGQAVTLIDVPQPVDDFDGVAITEEPGNGSPAPTGRDLLAGPIYSRNSDYAGENPFPRS
jgi:anti-sigma-K factor RskA